MISCNSSVQPGESGDVDACLLQSFLQLLCLKSRQVAVREPVCRCLVVKAEHQSSDWMGYTALHRAFAHQSAWHTQVQAHAHLHKRIGMLQYMTQWVDY